MASIVVYGTGEKRNAHLCFVGDDWRPPRTITYSFASGGTAGTAAGTYNVPPTGDSYTARWIAADFAKYVDDNHANHSMVQNMVNQGKEASVELEIRVPNGQVVGTVSCTTA